MPAKRSAPATKKLTSSGTKRKRTRHSDTYSSYIRKVLSQVHPDTGISKLAMQATNDMVSNAFNMIVAEAARIAQQNKKKTLTVREIQTAVRLILPGELAKHAVSEGTKAVTKFNSN